MLLDHCQEGFLIDETATQSRGVLARIRRQAAQRTTNYVQTLTSASCGIPSSAKVTRSRSTRRHVAIICRTRSSGFEDFTCGSCGYPTCVEASVVVGQAINFAGRGDIELTTQLLARSPDIKMA
jgi:hypothetical protein